jgi:hypothetical protein
MGARERRIYWDQEEDPKQERENDCGCKCNPTSRKKTKSKSVVTTCKEIIKVTLIQERNLSVVVEASNILSEIGGKHVEIPSEVMAKPLIPIGEKIKTQLEKEGM